MTDKDARQEFAQRFGHRLCFPKQDGKDMLNNVDRTLQRCDMYADILEWIENHVLEEKIALLEEIIDKPREYWALGEDDLVEKIEELKSQLNK